MTKREAFDKLRAVRGELDAAQFSLALTIRTVRESLKALQEAVRRGATSLELVRCRDKLEINFSEFEAALRA